MAWENVGTFDGIPFWADDSLALTAQDVTDNYLADVTKWKTVVETTFGLTADYSFLKDDHVFVVPTDIKDDPRWVAQMHWKLDDGRTVPDPDNQ